MVIVAWEIPASEGSLVKTFLRPESEDLLPASCRQGAGGPVEVGYVIWGTRFQASLCPAKLGLQMSPTPALTLCMTLFRHKKTAFNNFMPLSQND